MMRSRRLAGARQNPMRLGLVVGLGAAFGLGPRLDVPAAAQTSLPPSERIRPGDIVVANLGDHSVSVFDGETGAYRGPALEPGAGGLENPTGIAFGPGGDLYVGSSGNGRILRYDGAAGHFLGVFAEGPPLERPFSLIFGPDRHLFVSSRNAVLRYAPDGSFVGLSALVAGARARGRRRPSARGESTRVLRRDRTDSSGRQPGRRTRAPALVSG